MKFDSTVNLGQIMTALAMLMSIIGSYFLLKSDIRDHESRIVRIEQSVDDQRVVNTETTRTLGEIKTGIAVIRDRLERPSAPGVQNEVSPR